ncbi:MAG: LL-diaminopimelate aminotransferase [Deltaproteobacteria bacterium]|nr:LL-diaminopimelate aminotransferase [Deltaproteobacteria bacterium]
MTIIIHNSIADRLGGKNFGKEADLYKFAKIKKAKLEAMELYPDRKIIDLGVGEPDLPADKLIVDRLKAECGRPENRFYADNGIPEFRSACVKYMSRVYGVDNLTENNIMHGIGSKPILAMLSLCFINPGDITLMTVPGYPVLGTHTKYLGGSVYNLPLLEENAFYPDLSSIPDEILKKAKLLYINYPNNPTGQVATKAFYEEVVEFAKNNEIIIVADAAYASLVYEGNPLSIFSIDGAMDVAIEAHSLSKAFNMTGWRLAFVVGSKEVIKLYGTVKDNTDSGQFRAIQKAGCTALEHQEISKCAITKYSRRFDLLVPALREAGFMADKPQGSFYCYVPIPKGTKSGLKFNSAEQVAEYLIHEASIITVPWDDAGSYLRFSVTFEADTEEDERIVINAVKERLKGLELVF